MTEMEIDNKRVSLLQLPSRTDLPVPEETGLLHTKNFLRVKKREKDDLEILQENRNSCLFSGPYEVISVSEEKLEQEKQLKVWLGKRFMVKSFVICGILIFNAILGCLIFFYIFPSSSSPYHSISTTENTLSQLKVQNSTPFTPEPSLSQEDITGITPLVLKHSQNNQSTILPLLSQPIPEDY